MPVTTRTIVYSDLNCPFCFALNEWLEELGVDNQFLWMGVEHDPSLDLPTIASDDHEQSLLDEEVSVVRQRTQLGALRRPDIRPNSRLAIAAVAAARNIDWIKSSRLRTRLFRALWSENENISERKVIDSIASDVGLPGLDIDEDAIEQTDAWTRRWRATNINRIPVMVSPTGSQLLGLTSKAEVDVFMGSGLHDAVSPDGCRLSNA